MPKLKKFRQRIIEAMGQCHGNTATIDNAVGSPGSSYNQARRNSGTSADSRNKKSKKASKLNALGSSTSPNVSMHSQIGGGGASAAVHSSDTLNQVSERSSLSNEDILAVCIDPADVVISIEERVEHMINQMSPAELQQIQRRLRKITRSVRKKEGTGVGRNSMIINTSKSALSRSYLDDYVFKRLFSGGAEQISKGLEEWQKMKKRQWGAQQQALKQGNVLGAQTPASPQVASPANNMVSPKTAALVNLSIPTLVEEPANTDASDVDGAAPVATIAEEEDEENSITATFPENDTVEAVYGGGDDVASTSSASTSQLSRSQHSFVSPTKLGEVEVPSKSQPQALPRLPPPSPTRPAMTIVSHSLSNSSGLLPGGGGKTPKVDPLMSVYFLLLYSGETRWDSFAAQASWVASNGNLQQGQGAGAARGSGTGPSILASPTGNKRKHILRGVLNSSGGSTSNGNKAKELNDDDDASLHGGLPTPPGITFFMLSFVISVALRGTRQQKLLILFHACIPHKQIKAILQQSGGNSSSFPSYLFELGLETFDASLLSADSPSRNTELCGLEVSRPVAADILASLLLSTHRQQQQQNASHQQQSQSSSSFQLPSVPPILTQFTIGDMDSSNSNSHQNIITTVPQFTQLYNACCDEPKTLKFHEFVLWLTEEVGIGATEEGDATLDGIMRTLLLNDIVLSAESEREMMETFWTDWQDDNITSGLSAIKLSHAPSSISHNNSDAQNGINGGDNNEANGTTATSTANEKEGAEASSVITNGTATTAVSNSTTTTGKSSSHAKKKSGLWGFVSNAQNISTNGGPSAVVSSLSLSSRSNKANGMKPISAMTAARRTFGGIGNFDGRGGLGNGVLYCVDKSWWDKWIRYVGWSSGKQDEDQQQRQEGLIESRRGPPPRPPPLSNEALLAESAHDECGTQGSFEAMKPGLEQNKDYVLIPPPVWDTLYLLYGGGPPLPRMIDNNDSVAVMTDSTTPSPAITSIITKEDEHTENNDNREEEGINGDHSPSTVMPHIVNDVPVSVVVEPWVIACQVCDPLQPYRRGEAGPLSIRVMVTPGQPLWRFFAELVMRLPITNPRAREASGKGHARLWRKMDAAIVGDADNKDLANGSRFGPWCLLCKGRCVDFPLTMLPQSTEIDWSSYEKLWIEYADKASVESAGLSDGMTLMFEHSIIGKDSVVTWPREAAAKAGRMRRLAEEDATFRLKLRGLDKDGNPVINNESLEGSSIDAMDSSGRWYRSQIVQVETCRVQRKTKSSTKSSPTNGSSSTQGEKDAKVVVTEVARIKVDFCDVQFHDEWMEVDSDRLAVEGRYTVDSMKSLQKMQSDGPDTGTGSAMDSTSKTTSNYSLARKNGSGNDISSMDSGGSICSFPGYGACGLINLGNSCYMNVALQCVSYMPFIRSYLLSSQYKNNGDLNRENPLGTGGRLLEELSDLMRSMWTGKYGARSPTRFRSTLAKVRSQFSGTEQQDAQELLNAVFDALHEDSNKVRKKPMVPPIDDDWAKTVDLPRVGLEAWRRFLRRNRSVITNTAMGQVLNRVTCPTCKHSSINFDPFNMLSIPFPTVAEVWFCCTVIRRGSAANCPSVLDRKQKDSRDSGINADSTAPSESNVMESFVLSVSRLADIGDLKVCLEEKSGIPVERLRLCKGERVDVPAGFKGKIPDDNRYMKLVPLSDKEGPCVQLTKATGKDSGELSVTDIVVYESTLRPRVVNVIEREEGAPALSDDDKTVSSEDGDEAEGDNLTPEQTVAKRQRIRDELKYYGSSDECVSVDTEPTFLARSVSRCLWPQGVGGFRLGLRVDAMDQRDHWFPGSIVEISDFNPTDDDDPDESCPPGSRKVRVHFDNFSARWDEWYDFGDFQNGLVRPLYSHSTPKIKPTEVLVHHRMGLSTKKGPSSPSSQSEISCALFGQPFFVQFFNEWSTARAGAHVLAQASRFLQSCPPSVSPIIADNSLGSDKLEEAIETACATISEAIEVLVSSERSYIQNALAMNEGKDAPDGKEKSFDAAAMTSALSEKLGSLLPRLPFDVRVCSSDSISTEGMRGDHEESSFPFSLVRTVGNYLHSKNAIILHWRNLKLEKRAKKAHSSAGSNSCDGSDATTSSTVYGEPDVRVHPDNTKLLVKAKKSKKGQQSDSEADVFAGSMDVGVCLAEFCKQQKLSIDDCWMCPRCKDLRAGLQSMSLWRLPDILTFHIKRFNCSARWREKISTRINFPLTGLDLSPWCEENSVALNADGATSSQSTVYDLIGVVNHLGGMTGGHYVSACKATACGPDGCEELAHSFNGHGCNGDPVSSEYDDQGNAWRLPGRGGNKDSLGSAHPSKTSAIFSGKAVPDSTEPLWLQFDDDLVEPIPPKSVVSEMAYVLFYRRRHVTSSNIARYSTLE